ncbi:MAG: hypothetical protein VYC11_04490 [Candidatus Thermoplasmatota archaeon]|nr:hypothetical protein [Candidatus Thermoplasmatota archaeon]
MSDEEEINDDFSKMDTDGDGVISREEFEAAQEASSTLTGNVSFYQDDTQTNEISQNEPKKMMNKNLQFFLGVLVYPIVVLFVAFFLSQLGWAIFGGDVAGLINLTVMGAGVVGGTVLGFTTGHHSFAWGVLASVIVIPMLLFALLFGFCMLIIMSGDGALV